MRWELGSSQLPPHTLQVYLLARNVAMLLRGKGRDGEEGVGWEEAGAFAARYLAVIVEGMASRGYYASTRTGKYEYAATNSGQYAPVRAEGSEVGGVGVSAAVSAADAGSNRLSGVGATGQGRGSCWRGVSPLHAASLTLNLALHFAAVLRERRAADGHHVVGSVAEAELAVLAWRAVGGVQEALYAANLSCLNVPAPKAGVEEEAEEDWRRAVLI